MKNENKSIFPKRIISLSILLFCFYSPAFASPYITSFLLNSNSGDTVFNPNEEDEISIEVKANTAVKFTRLYICSIEQICNGTSGNHIRYFTQSNISDMIMKAWNGKKSGDIEVVPEGEYKVMVSMTEEPNDPVLEFAPHSIFIDFSNQQNTNLESTDTSSNSTPNKDPINIIDISTHSGQEDLTQLNTKSSIEVSAGRERVAFIGTPVEFSAQYKILENTDTPTFLWSFGDGLKKYGERVTHTYKYEGEYIVVLNAIGGNQKTASRTRVRVISPKVSLSISPDSDIEVINEGKTEINLGLWELRSMYNRFTLSEDTIIGNGKKITLSSKDTMIKPITSSKISLYNPSGDEVATTLIKDDKPIATTSLEIILSFNERKAVIYEEPILDTKHVEYLDNKEDDVPYESIEEVREAVHEPYIIDKDGDSEPKGFWRNIFKYPFRGIQSFGRIFYDF